MYEKNLSRSSHINYLAFSLHFYPKATKIEVLKDGDLLKLH
jgi:hypothetical protein